MDEIQRVGDRNYCLNCRADIRPLDAYCRQCGQKVDDNKLGLSKVLSEFFENYISLDSRFGRSIVPFLFKPGYLSQQFIIGRRRGFANPFRLYILSSILFFFCLSSQVDPNTGVGDPIINIQPEELENFRGLDSLRLSKPDKELDSETKKALNELSDSTFKIAYKYLPESQRKKVLNQLDEQDLKELGLLADTSLLRKDVEPITENVKSEASTGVGMADVAQYRDSTHLSNEEVYDILIGDEQVPFHKEIVFKRMIRLSRADDNDLRRYIVGNLSLAMFVLLPLFALVLKLFYFRRNKYYVAHLIHTIYLQSFAFILYSLSLSLLNLFPTLEESKGALLFFTFLIFFVYFLFSLKRLYSQGYGKTFLKTVLLTIAYGIVGFFVFLGEVLTSFLFF